MINARMPLQNVYSIPTSPLPFLRWRNEWNHEDGASAIIGLIDTGFVTNHPDLIQADITVRKFTSEGIAESRSLEHGTHSITTLVGQGVSQILGIAPKTKLHVASMVSQNNIIKSEDIVQALEWLIKCNVSLIIIPMGDSLIHSDIENAIQYANQRNISIFAAAGNSYPRPILFPANNSLTISVGAIDSAQKLLSSSCRFPKLDLVAPGFEILAPISATKVKACTGSSVGCVLAGGAAILAISANNKIKTFNSPKGLLKHLLG